MKNILISRHLSQNFTVIIILESFFGQKFRNLLNQLLVFKFLVRHTEVSTRLLIVMRGSFNLSHGVDKISLGWIVKAIDLLKPIKIFEISDSFKYTWWLMYYICIFIIPKLRSLKVAINSFCWRYGGFVFHVTNHLKIVLTN